jgi:uncharacterized protein YuzE
MTFSYDDDADVLYVTFKEGARRTYVENDQGDVLLLDPQSGEIVGCTILFFLRRAREGPINIPEIGVVPFNQIAGDLLNERKHQSRSH